MRYKLAVAKLRLLAEACDIESGASHQQRSPSSSGDRPAGIFPDKCAVLIVILYLSGIKRYSVKLSHDALHASSLS